MSDKFDTPEIPSGWSMFLPQVTTILRGIMWGAAILGLVKPDTLGEPALTALASVVLLIVATVWGIVKNMRTQRALRQAAASPAGSAPPRMPS